MIDVSIIIVSYNTKDLTRNCLQSVLKQTQDIDYEIIVSDNGSKDGSVEMIKKEFPNVILLENNANLGFGSANNRGLKIAKGKYIFYLNSDTVLLNNAIKFFFDYWENADNKEQIGALGAGLLNERMQEIHSGGPFKDYKYLTKLLLLMYIRHSLKTLIFIFGLSRFFSHKNVDNTESVPKGETLGFITGADLFLRNNEYAKFDEKFFMYCEETDLQLRLQKNGYRRYIISEPKIQHLVASCPKTFTIVTFSEVCTQNSCIYYSQKNLHKKAIILKILVWIDRLNPLVRKVVRKIPLSYQKPMKYL